LPTQPLLETHPSQSLSVELRSELST
jgi:hypothetical protein